MLIILGLVWTFSVNVPFSTGGGSNWISGLFTGATDSKPRGVKGLFELLKIGPYPSFSSGVCLASGVFSPRRLISERLLFRTSTAVLEVIVFKS